MILLFIQTIFPIVNIVIEVTIKLVMRTIVRMKTEATQVCEARLQPTQLKQCQYLMARFAVCIERASAVSL
jgi:hypothetical protein